MTKEQIGLLAELTACRKIVEDYTNRLDDACEEYYSTGKTVFSNLTRTEDQDIHNHCTAILPSLDQVIPDASTRWNNIKFLYGQEMVESLRNVWTRRRNLFRIFETNLKTRLELENFAKSDAQ